MSIFVVDDHPLMREAVVMLIRRLNSKLSVIELDRLAAVGPAVLAHGRPELICLDLKLPDTHGVSGVRELKLQFPEVPIIVLSAASGQDYEDLSLEAGAQAFISKSAGAAEISTALRALLLNEEGELVPAEEEPVDEEELKELLKPKFQKHIYPDSVIFMRGEDDYIR